MPRGARRAIQPAPTRQEVEAALSPRAQDSRRERRMRDPGDLDRMNRSKLAIPPEVQERLDREGKVARWMLDADQRLSDVSRIDWDKTPGVAPIPSDGTNLVLHEKYRDWWESDQRTKQSFLDEKDRAIAQGKITADGNSLAQDYFTRELTRANRISR